MPAIALPLILSLFVSLPRAQAHHLAAQGWQGGRDLCAILANHDAWAGDTLRAARRWQVQPSLLLAIVFHESRFNGKAKSSKSSAYGYSQAIDATWGRYERNARAADGGARRDNFRDAIDFVGWYVSTIKRSLGVHAPKAIYLAYHEGERGFRNKNYLAKPWLWSVADAVAETERIFREQWRACYGFSLAQLK